MPGWVGIFIGVFGLLGAVLISGLAYLVFTAAELLDERLKRLRASEELDVVQAERSSASLKFAGDQALTAANELIRARHVFKQDIQALHAQTLEVTRALEALRSAVAHPPTANPYDKEA